MEEENQKSIIKEDIRERSDYAHSDSYEARGKKLQQINQELQFFDEKASKSQQKNINEEREREFQKKKQELQNFFGDNLSEEDIAIIHKNIVDDAHEQASGAHERFRDLESEKKILEYLQNNLPQSEERIPEPMNPACEVSVVIPAYGEREYILRPLETLANQKNIDPRQYEVIVVVNNPGSEPGSDAKESPSDVKRKIEHYHKALVENSQTLQLIRYIQGENVQVDISDKEKEAVQSIINSGVKIFFIDKASEGKTLADGESNVGGARNRGVAEAVARFYEYKHSNGIIAQTDADARVDEYYIHNIITAFKENPDIVGAAGQLKFEQTQPQDAIFKEVSAYGQLEYYYWLATELLFNERVGKTKENILLMQGIHFSGANMLSRAYESAIVGGVKKIDGGEDPDFGMRLASIGEVARLETVKTFPADRYSPRTAVDAGHGQQKLKYAEAIKNNKTILVPDPRFILFLQEMDHKAKGALLEKKTSIEDISAFVTVDNQILLGEEELQLLAEKLSGIESIEDLHRDQQLLDIGMVLKDKIEKIYPALPIEIASKKALEMLLQGDAHAEEKSEEIKYEIICSENKAIEKRLQTLDIFLNIVFEKERESFDSEDLMRIITENQHDIGISDEGIEEIRNDKELSARIVDIIQGSSSKQQAMETWKNLYSEELTFAQENSLRMRIIELKAILKAKEKLL